MGINPLQFGDLKYMGGLSFQHINFGRNIQTTPGINHKLWFSVHRMQVQLKEIWMLNKQPYMWRKDWNRSGGASHLLIILFSPNIHQFRDLPHSLSFVINERLHPLKLLQKKDFQESWRANRNTPEASAAKSLIEGFKACSLIQDCLHMPETEKNE